MVTDLWPEFTVTEKPSGVIRVLTEAGEELRKKTQDRMDLLVRQDLGHVGDLPIRFNCELSVPKLNHYRYFLCQIDAGVEGFPVTVTSGHVERTGIISEDQLREALAEVFHTERLKRVMQNLLSMTV